MKTCGEIRRDIQTAKIGIEEEDRIIDEYTKLIGDLNEENNKLCVRMNMVGLRSDTILKECARYNELLGLEQVKTATLQKELDIYKNYIKTICYELGENKIESCAHALYLVRKLNDSYKEIYKENEYSRNRIIELRKEINKFLIKIAKSINYNGEMTESKIIEFLEQFPTITNSNKKEVIFELIISQHRIVLSTTFEEAKQSLYNIIPNDYSSCSTTVAKINLIPTNNTNCYGIPVYIKEWHQNPNDKSLEFYYQDYIKIYCFCGWEGYITDCLKNYCCPFCKRNDNFKQHI